MIRLEIISVRTAGKAEALSVLELCRQICPPRMDGRLVTMKVYCSTGYETDISIHIYWNSDSGRHGKSPFGLEVTQVLSDFGLINHTLWMEQEGVITDGTAPM